MHGISLWASADWIPVVRGEFAMGIVEWQGGLVLSADLPVDEKWY